LSERRFITRNRTFGHIVDPVINVAISRRISPWTPTLWFLLASIRCCRSSEYGHQESWTPRWSASFGYCCRSKEWNSRSRSHVPDRLMQCEFRLLAPTVSVPDCFRNNHIAAFFNSIAWVVSHPISAMVAVATRVVVCVDRVVVCQSLKVPSDDPLKLLACGTLLQRDDCVEDWIVRTMAREYHALYTGMLTRGLSRTAWIVALSIRGVGHMTCSTRLQWELMSCLGLGRYSWHFRHVWSWRWRRKPSNVLFKALLHLPKQNIKVF